MSDRGRFALPGRLGLLAVAGALACAALPPPIRYVAATRPDFVRIRAASEPVPRGRGLLLKQMRFGILYRAPVDVRAMIEALQEQQDVSVLTNAELRLRTPFCYTIFCVGQDEVTADPEHPAARPPERPPE